MPMQGIKAICIDQNNHAVPDYCMKYNYHDSLQANLK